MTFKISTSVPQTSVDEVTGNQQIVAPEGGATELQDSTGETQIKISDGLTAIGDNVFVVGATSVDSNKPANMNNGLTITIDDVLDIPLQINNISDTEMFKITQGGNLVLNGTTAINKIVSVIDENEPTNSTSLINVSGVVDYIHSRETGVLSYIEKNSKADFDILLTSSEIDPSIVLLTDSTPFDYTDTKGNIEIGLTWWLGIVEKPSGGVLTTSTLFNSNSQDSLTGPEIASALYAESNTNRYTDSDKVKVNNLPNDTNSELSTKANISGQVFSGIVQVQNLGTTSTNALQAISIGNGGINNTGVSKVAWRVGTATNARSGNYRAMIGMNYDTGKFEISTGNSTNTNNILKAIEVDAFRNVSVNGSPVLNQVNVTTNINETTFEKIPNAITTKAAINAAVTGNIECNSIKTQSSSEFKTEIVVKDNSDTNISLKPFNRGLIIRSKLNPLEEEAIFSVESSSGGMRLRAEHSGALSTGNEYIKVGTNNDGTGGRLVLEEGNWALIQTDISYHTSFPNPTNQEKVGWSGRTIYFIGVGTGTIILPQIVEDNPTASQFKTGEKFTVDNFNSGSDITFTAHSNNKFMKDNVNSANISAKGADFDVFASSRVEFCALDLRGYSIVGDFCWVVRGI